MHMYWGEVNHFKPFRYLDKKHEEAEGLVALDPHIPFLWPTRLPSQTSEPSPSSCKPCHLNLSALCLDIFSVPSSLQPNFQILALIVIPLWNKSWLKILYEGRVASITSLHLAPAATQHLTSCFSPSLRCLHSRHLHTRYALFVEDCESFFKSQFLRATFSGPQAK